MSIEEYLERLGDHGPHGFMYDPEGRELALREIVQSALAERTEQCAKIAEDLAAFWKKEETRIDLNEDAKVYCHGRQTVLKAAATQIRALNQPETKS